MARPVDPTSQNQVEKRARLLRSEESGWTQSLALTIARAALKAWQWSHYLENGGEPGPLAGTFPRLPEEPGSCVLVGASEVTDLSQTDRRRSRVRGDQWLVDGQADGCKAPDTEQLAMAMELTSLLQERHLHLLLRTAFYKEVAVWIGELLKAPRIGLNDEEEAFVFLDRRDGVDLWMVPEAALGLPPEEDFPKFASEELALCAACWHFGRKVYRELLDPKVIGGQSGLERPALLRQLLEELNVVLPRGLSLKDLGEGSLARMTTHKTALVASTALCRSDRWIEEEGRGLFREEKPRKEFWEMTLAAPDENALAYLSLAECRRVLEMKNSGLEIAALHGVLCTCVMQLEDPRADFSVSGDFLIKALGLDDRRWGGQTRSDLLKKVYVWSHSLGLARCGGWSKPRNAEPFHVKQGLLWMIETDTYGVSQLDLLDEETSQEVDLTDLTVTVKAGSWAETQRTQRADHLLYVPIATEILRLNRRRGEMAFRLGLWLGTEHRVRPDWWATGKGNIRVGELLEKVLPEPDLRRAKETPEGSRNLRERWGQALATLRDEVGFSFTFPGCLPALIPSGFPGHEGQAPRGALDLLLNSRVEIHWPEKVRQARLQPSLEEVSKKEIRQATARRLTQKITDNASKLREAVEATGLSQREVAPRLGISQSQLSKLQKGPENGGAPLPTPLLQTYLARLETLKRRKA
ncbi:MAG: helix-turn-helix transcriptional regulator [Cyanobacteria bacterium K_DeepCast_35m_m2_023]|nr:helix-turn-helix transcriptional regulator [Cyanobacteria bacterium K_DeepCast_35m_m2_023]